MSSTEEVIFREAVRAIEQQERALDELRARAGTVLAAIALATSFLGARALGAKGGIGVWGWLGLLLSGGCGFFALLILWPATDWVFANGPLQMLRDHNEHPAHPESVYAFLAEEMGNDRQSNHDKLTPLYNYLRVSIVLLLLAVAAWIVQIARR